MNFGSSSTRDHCSYTWSMGALTTTDCRAAFISIGADPIVRVGLSGGEPSVLLPGKNPAPSVGKVKERHVQQEHWVVPARTSSKQLTRSASRCALVQFCFHLVFCLRQTVGMALPRHHRAVGGFFSAPQERAAYPSFEGETKVAGRRGLLPFCCAQMRKIDDGARRERSDVEGQREALTSGQRINQSHLRRP